MFIPGLNFSTAPAVTTSPNNITIEYNSTSSAGTKNATFLCAFNGDPLPAVEWFKGSLQLSGSSKYSVSSDGTNSSVLKINNVDVNDIGSYACNVSNNESSVLASASLGVVGMFMKFVFSDRCVQMLLPNIITDFSCKLLSIMI